MKFDLTVSITDIISVLTIILTFVTILQVKHQRTDTLKPYITIRPIDKVYRFDCKSKKLLESPKVQLSNIGSNLAKDIKIELLIANIPDSLISKGLKITQNTCLIDKQKLIMLHHNIDFTYCESKENIEIGNNLYGYIETFCHIYADLFLSKKIEVCLKNSQFPKSIIKISYFNILGKKHDKYLCLYADPFFLSTDAIDFHIKTHELSKKEYQKIMLNLKNKSK